MQAELLQGMKIEIKNAKENAVNLMRKIGYSFQRSEGVKMSFIRPLAGQGFPRFHIYTETFGSDVIVNIHLDQKKETYGNDTRHHGEYEDEGALKNEVERIQSLLQ